jgi:hypothetical protein
MFFQIDAKKNYIFLIFTYITLLLLSFFTFVAPGASYVTVWLNDIMGLADVANRVYLGQVPYKDFQFPYGPLVAIIPGLGISLGLNLGQIFGFNGIVVASLLCMTEIIILSRRFTVVPALLILFFTWILIVVPMGETMPFNFVTWGTFYNRQGIAALIITFLLYVEPEYSTRRSKLIDALAISVLLLFEFYDKVTFAAIAFTFVIVNATVSRHNRQVSLLGVLFAVIFALMFEAFFHFHVNYFSNILQMSRMQNGNLFGIWRMLPVLINFSPFVLNCFAALLLVFFAGRRSWFDVLYVAGILVANILIHGTTGAVSVYGVSILLVAVFMSIGELARRSEFCKNSEINLHPKTILSHYPAFLMCLFFLVMSISSEVLNRLVVWHDFTSKVTRYHSSSGVPERLSSTFTKSNKGTNTILYERDNLIASEYMKTLIDGSKKLSALGQFDKSVITFDMVNPFPYTTGMIPPVRGYPLFFIYGLTINEGLLPTPSQFFGNAYYVMIPVLPINDDQLKIMMRLYGSYLKKNYFIFEKTEYWEIWIKNLNS